MFYKSVDCVHSRPEPSSCRPVLSDYTLSPEEELQYKSLISDLIPVSCGKLRALYSFINNIYLGMPLELVQGFEAYLMEPIPDDCVSLMIKVLSKMVQSKGMDGSSLEIRDFYEFVLSRELESSTLYEVFLIIVTVGKPCDDLVYKFLNSFDTFSYVNGFPISIYLHALKRLFASSLNKEELAPVLESIAITLIDTGRTEYLKGIVSLLSAESPYNNSIQLSTPLKVCGYISPEHFSAYSEIVNYIGMFISPENYSVFNPKEIITKSLAILDIYGEHGVVPVIKMFTTLVQARIDDIEAICECLPTVVCYSERYIAKQKLMTLCSKIITQTTVTMIPDEVIEFMREFSDCEDEL